MKKKLALVAILLVIVMLVLALPMQETASAFAASKCRHRKTYTETYKTRYIENDDETHIRKWYRIEVCKSCDEVVDKWTEEKERSHDFDCGICEDCGYEKELTVEELIREESIIV